MRKSWTSEKLTLLTQHFELQGALNLESTLGFSAKTIAAKARELGLPPSRAKQEGLRRYSRNSKTVNATYFDGDWHPEMAYVLGYIWADGCLRNGNVLALRCQALDEEVLLKVRDYMKSVHRVSYKEAYTDRKGTHHKRQVICQIGNRVLVEGIVAKLGVGERKSYSNPSFPPMPADCHPHFARGVLDGDGSVRGKKGNRSIYWMGTPLFIHQLAKVIASGAGIPPGDVYPDKTQRKVYWRRIPDLQRLYQWLYPTPDTFGLRRKKDALMKAALPSTKVKRKII